MTPSPRAHRRLSRSGRGPPKTDGWRLALDLIGTVRVALPGPRTLQRAVGDLGGAKGALEGLNGDVRYYTSAIAADDLDDVRAALGYDLINVYGGSYGATLAQYYLRQHEAHVRAVVLDSGTLIDVPIVELMAARSQEALDRVFARCHSDPGCHASYPDPARDLRKALRRLSQHPVETDAVDYGSGEHVVLTSDSLAGRVHDLLVTGQSGEIPRLVHVTAEADYEPLASLVLAALRQPDPAQLGGCSGRWNAPRGGLRTIGITSPKRAPAPTTTCR